MNPPPPRAGPLFALRREVALAQLLAALPRLAALDLRTPSSPDPKRWSRASLDQLRLVAGCGKAGRGGGAWRGRLLLPPAAGRGPRKRGAAGGA